MQAEQFSSGWRSSEDLQKKQEQLLLTIVDNVVCVATALAQAPAAAFPHVAAFTYSPVVAQRVLSGLVAFLKLMYRHLD